MKRDAIILLAATCVLSVFAYNGRYTDKADLSMLQNVVETECVMETEFVVETEQIEETEYVQEMEYTLENEVAIDSENTEEIEMVTETEILVNGFRMYSAIWDRVQMTFFEDGTCVFEMPEFQVVENCTWSYEEGVLSVTREDGEIFISYIDEDRTTLKLDYVALIDERLVGQFDSLDYKSFFEAE